MSQFASQARKISAPTVVAAVSALVFGWNAVPALAHAAHQSGTQLKLHEVIVTAERRAENVERTPLAITAISGSQLGTLGVTSATHLNGLVPDVHIGNAGPGVEISIRGIVSTNNTEVGDPAVAFNVDGVYLALSRSAAGTLFDIKRIEVLRGPQGTLYGRNATAGAINVITNKPDFRRSYGKVALDYGNYNTIETFGMINLPVDSKFAMRAAFMTNHHSGYSTNFPAQPYNDLASDAARVEALWKPLRNLSFLLSMNYYHDGGAGAALNAPIGLYAIGGHATPYDFPVSANAYNDETAKGVTLTAKWALPIGTLTYIGDYRQDDWHNSTGSDAVGSYGSSCATATSANCQNVVFSSLQGQTSDELRLSNSVGALKWVGGLYYFREHNNVFLGLSPIAGITSLAFVQPSVSEVSRAVYGQVTYSLTRHLRLIGGLRYNKDHKGRIGSTDAFGPIVGETCAGCIPLYNNFASLNWSKLTWKAGVDVNVNRRTMLFGTVATGFKDGGYGDGVPPNNHPYNPETILAYELGTKNVLFHHRLQVNADAFYDLYKNYQASGLALVAGQPSTVTLNAGKATIDGVELETEALLTRHDELSISASYLHAYFTQFDLPLGDAFNSGPVSYAGNTLPNAPHFTLHLGYQHVFELRNGAALVPRIDTGWTGKQNLDYHNYALTEQSAYTRTDLSLTYQAPRTWRVMLYVHNLENNAVLTTAAPDPRAITQAIGRQAGYGIYMAPRTYGVRISASF